MAHAPSKCKATRSLLCIASESLFTALFRISICNSLVFYPCVWCVSRLQGLSLCLLLALCFFMCLLPFASLWFSVALCNKKIDRVLERQIVSAVADGADGACRLMKVRRAFLRLVVFRFLRLASSSSAQTLLGAGINQMYRAGAIPPQRPQH